MQVILWGLNDLQRNGNIFPVLWVKCDIHLSIDDGKLSLEEFQSYFTDGILTDAQMQEMYYSVDRQQTEWALLCFWTPSSSPSPPILLLPVRKRPINHYNKDYLGITFTLLWNLEVFVFLQENLLGFHKCGVAGLKLKPHWHEIIRHYFVLEWINL